jgi:hypothetical protein
MGETISLDDYTTLPGKSGATHSISLCIARPGFGFGFYTARDPLVAPAPPGPIRRARTE